MLLRPITRLIRALNNNGTPIGVGLMYLIPNVPVTQSIRGKVPGSRFWGIGSNGTANRLKDDVLLIYLDFLIELLRS